MPRLIILTLPLVLLWLVLRGGMQSASFEAGDAQVNGQRVRGEVNLSGVDVRAREREERRRFFSKRASFQKLEGESLENFEKRKESIFKDEEELRERLVEKIMGEISPDLLAHLSEEDLELLRSYVSGFSSASPREQPWLCWGPGVSEEKVAAFHEAEKLSGLAGQGVALFAKQFLGPGNWNRTATNGTTGGVQGTPVTVTWSIVADGTSVPGLSIQSTAPSEFRAWMASIYGGETSSPAEDQEWFEIFEAAFEVMAEASGITLIYEPADDGVGVRSFNVGVRGVRGDIRIGARPLDGNSNTLAFAFAPDVGDIIFDSSDDVFDNTSSNSIRLFNVIAHELGHSLGLGHVCPINRTKLMEPILGTNFRGPRFDEYQSLQRLYGDPLELGEGVVNNDTISNATLMELESDQTFEISRLSIDDDRDVDVFRIPALAGQKLSVALRPGEGRYLEGAETADGCSGGTEFSSNDIHDLGIELIAPDQTSVLNFVNRVRAGDVEVMNQFELQEDGDYFVRVFGGDTNGAQLYRLTLRLGDRDPAARLRVGEERVIAESGSVKNARLDPNETVKVEIELENIGELPTGSLFVSASGSENVVLFSSAVSPQLAGGESGTVELTFAGLGECGDLANLQVEVGDELGSLASFEREFKMGEILTERNLDENFDASSSLPSGWESIETRNGEDWRPSSSRFVSALRSAFAPGVGSVSESLLLTPTFELTSGGGILSFEHSYAIETSFDGGVLEASRNGGEWFDLIENPEVTVTGGYDLQIRSGFSSAIAGRNAWTGRQGEFMRTTVDFPVEWAGDSVQLRWRLVHDQSSSDDGWWIDNVQFERMVLDCEVHRPVVNLIRVEGELDENRPEGNVILNVTSELPLAQPLEVVLGFEGSAERADFLGDLGATIPAGEQSVAVSLSAFDDGLTEGEESLRVIVPSDQLGFAAGENASEEFTITDQLTFEVWAAQFFDAEVPLNGDSDGDGLSEIAEYLLGTDPSSRASNRFFDLRRVEDGFMLPLPDLPERIDATLGAESSDDLDDWSPVSFERRLEGLFFESTEGRSFLRLTFSLNDPLEGR